MLSGRLGRITFETTINLLRNVHQIFHNCELDLGKIICLGRIALHIHKRCIIVCFEMNMQLNMPLSPESRHIDYLTSLKLRAPGVPTTSIDSDMVLGFPGESMLTSRVEEDAL